MHMGSNITLLFLVQDMNKLQSGELPEEELRVLEADLTGKVRLSLCILYFAALNDRVP